MSRQKCHDLDEKNSVDLETWAGRNDIPECSIPTNLDVRHVVKVTNWRRKTIEVRIEGEAMNDRGIFESSNDRSWTKTITIVGRKNGSGKDGYGREYVMGKASEIGNDETIKTRIVYWSKYNRNRNEEDKQVHFDIDLV